MCTITFTAGHPRPQINNACNQGNRYRDGSVPRLPPNITRSAKCYNKLFRADSTTRTRSSRTLSELRSRTGPDRERRNRARRGLESVLIPCPNTVIESNEARAGQLFAALLLPADVFHPGEILPYTIRGTHYDYTTTSKHASSSVYLSGKLTLSDDSIVLLVVDVNNTLLRLDQMFTNLKKVFFIQLL